MSDVTIIINPTESANAINARVEVDGEIVEKARELTGEDYVYVQRNFTVTDGLFIDENIIFDNVTAEWIEFCINVLGMKFPRTELDKPNPDDG